MEAVAKHEFNATADDELSFRKNQVLKVSPDNTMVNLVIQIIILFFPGFP